MYTRSSCSCHLLSCMNVLASSHPVLDRRLDADGVLVVCMCSVSADAFDINRFMPLAERLFTDGGTDSGGGGGGGNGAQCVANAAASSSSKSGGFKSNGGGGGGGGGGSSSNANANANANSRELMYVTVFLVFVWPVSLLGPLHIMPAPTKSHEACNNTSFSLDHTRPLATQPRL